MNCRRKRQQERWSDKKSSSQREIDKETTYRERESGRARAFVMTLFSFWEFRALYLCDHQQCFCFCDRGGGLNLNSMYNPHTRTHTLAYAKYVRCYCLTSFSTNFWRAAFDNKFFEWRNLIAAKSETFNSWPHYRVYVYLGPVAED